MLKMRPHCYQVICGLLLVGFIEFIGANSHSEKGHHDRSTRNTLSTSNVDQACYDNCTVSPITVQVCEGEDLRLECKNPDQILHIIRANYGRTSDKYCQKNTILSNNFNTQGCRAEHSLRILKERCEDYPSCLVPANNNIFGDPCVNVYKYLEVKYICQDKPGPPPKPQVSYACDGSPVTLKCPNNEVIRVLGADYGRWTRTVCNSEPIQNMNCHSDRLKTIQYVQGVCENKNNCEIGAGNGYNDPCVNTFKHLEIIYTCNAVYLGLTPKNELWKAVHGCDGDINNLECPNGRLINIHVADDGRWNRIICNREPIKTLSCYADSQISLDAHKKSCDNKTTCSIGSSGGPQPDPCYGTLKFSEIIYTCDEPPPKPRDTSVAVCEGESASLKCTNDEVIYVLDAVYGKLDNDKCDLSTVNHTTECSNNNAREVVQKYCNNKPFCSVPASNSLFGDNCVGILKYLDIKYTCECGCSCRRYP